MATQSKTKSWNIKEAILEAIGKGQSVVNGMTKGAAQAELEVSRKNWIINGNGEVDQRGMSGVKVTGYDTYTLDRWKARVGVTLTQTPDGFTIETDGGYTNRFAYQIIEDGYSLFVGKTITVSFEYKRLEGVYDGSQYSGASLDILNSGGGFLESFIGTPLDTSSDDWVTVNMTTTVPVNASGSTIRLALVPAYTATTAKIQVRKVKLEIGDTATPFESRSYAEELALCQRYYQRITAAAYGGFVNGAMYSPTTFIGALTFPVMRGAPTFNSSGTIRVLAAGASYPCSAVSSNNASDRTIRVEGTVSGATAGEGGVMQANNDATAYFELIAEI